jgi:nuclear pore complex protein Nup98-Nup96
VNHTLEGGIYPTVQEPISGATKDVRFTKLPTFVDVSICRKVFNGGFADILKASPQTLNFQKEYTDVSIKNGAPFAQTTYSYFSWLAEAVSIRDAAGIREQQAWALLSLLFDEVDQAPNDMTDEYFQQYKDRYRKDKLSEFWKALVKKDADQDVQAAKTAEEKAIAHLSGYNISSACQALLSGMDLRLATMVAQIGGDATMRDQMTEQLEDWGGNDMLSEMEEPVRALYELLSGNCARSECKASDGRENKVRAFGIAARFGLDWRRAFGLRLWYGTLVDEPIEVAIAQFADALREGYEEVKPVPWFVEKGLDMGWKDPEPDSREDILWGILKLYASSTDYKVPTNIEDVLAPENVSGHPLNARLSFQLFRFFKSRLDELEEGDTRRVEMPTARTTDGLRKSFMSSTALNAGNEEQAADALVELGDKLTITYAASLHTREHWKIALLIYSHVSQPAAREQPMRALLDQFSDTYEPVESDTTYKELVDELKIPAQWIHAAAALQAKSKGNNIQQVTHLIKAGELEAAHEVLCRSVAPDCIISRDYDALRELLGEFLPKPPTGPADELVSTASRAHARRPKEVVQGWSQGGQIYFDYIHLLDLTSHVSSYRIDEQLDNEIKELLSKLQGSLKNVASKQLKGCELEERVALIEIAGVVADLIAKNLVCSPSLSLFRAYNANTSQQLERSRILELPLTEDLWLRHSLDLSASYYQAIMAGK